MHEVSNKVTQLCAAENIVLNSKQNQDCFSDDDDDDELMLNVLRCELTY